MLRWLAGSGFKSRRSRSREDTFVEVDSNEMSNTNIISRIGGVAEWLGTIPRAASMCGDEDGLRHTAEQMQNPMERVS